MRGLAPVLLVLLVGPVDAATIRFRDVTKASRVDFDFEVDFGRGKMLSTMGGGVATGDYDLDGDVDIYFAGSVADGRHPQEGPCGQLWRNRGDGSFDDVTASSGIRSCGWQMGASFVDVDSDGAPDLVTTGVEENRIFRNLGNGSFREVTKEWGFETGNLFAIGLAAGDVDGDGRVDLYPLGYLDTNQMKEKSYPTLQIRIPEDYPTQPGLLFLQKEPGRLTNSTATCGCENPEGKGTGAVFLDYDLDGRLDLFVANDRVANRLYRNEGEGKFRDVTDETGAGAREGKPRAGMGIAVGDPFGSGYPSILVTNFGGEENLLYRNLEGVVFDDASAAANLGKASWPYLQWGTGFFDFDDDGAEDFYAVSGHLIPRWIRWISAIFGPGSHEDMYLGDQRFKQPALVWRNRGDGTFDEVTATSGDYRTMEVSGRGTAAADLDGDGRLDLVVGVLGGRPRLLRNDTAPAGHAIEILPVAGENRRTVIGTKVRLTAGGKTRTQEFIVFPSYASGTWLPLHFGLGESTVVETIEVIPPGATEPAWTLSDVAADRLYRLRDGRLETVRKFRR